ncbi:MAG: hypothetical protein ACD_3C00111G0031 [uncultured bacterium (gcode 4)]|uniref:Uncharacterized protein n=1 Tax=uncultured bacterium (gcode 4) TaxID=1234023 RepID=K2GCR5_9BACT|nr:MAG: hypothetical protein ACD_3C00111G0031 [uncultured bacterium (gcode 4)]
MIRIQNKNYQVTDWKWWNWGSWIVIIRYLTN